MSLLPPNATPLEAAFEGAFNLRLAGLDPAGISHVWRAALCAPAALPWLASALSVDHWDPDWPLSVRRAVVAAAPQVHRLKGTVTALKVSLATIGARARITEWFQQAPPATPGTFRALALVGSRWVTGEPVMSAARIEAIRRAITMAAPVSRPWQLDLGIETTTSLASSTAVTRALRVIDRAATLTANRSVHEGLSGGAAARRPMRVNTPDFAITANRTGGVRLQAAMTARRPLRIINLDFRMVA